jgi:geranylgeranyl diphosphate synthase type II
VLATPRPERTPDDVAWLRERMDAYGCLTHANAVAHALAGAARHEFATAFGGLPPSRDKEFIAALVTWVLERR